MIIITAKKIGLFDSGIGGVTVLREMLKILPNEDYIYYSDSINNPYGDKTDEEVFEICDKILAKLIKNCKIIVIACNTASAKAVDRLRRKYVNIPIVAIEPAYKIVHDYFYDKPTLVMATKGTIESEKFYNLYNKYNNHKTLLLPCVGLADAIEKGDKNEIQNYLKDNLSQYAGKFENVVLGCTHYPLIKDEIESILGKVTFFDGSVGLAKNVKNILEKNALYTKNTHKGSITFIDTSNSEEKKKRFFEICNW